MKILAMLLSAIVVISCDMEVQENRGRKKASDDADANQSQQPAFDSEKSGDKSAVAGEKTQTESAENKSVQKIPGCEVGAFSAKLSGSISKSVAERSLLGTINIQIKGDGQLSIDNDPLRLKLNLAVSNLTTSPDIDLVKQEARKELNKALGERTLDVADKAQQDAIKAKQGVWSDYSCLVGMVKTYKFPVENGAVVTVVFEPALPFAAYPDKVNDKFSAAATAGITFEGVSGKVVDVKGSTTTKVGDLVSGNVKVEKSGTGYKFNYNFGDFKSLAKIGLFTSIVYAYTPNNVQSISATIPIKEGKDSITVEFK